MLKLFIKFFTWLMTWIGTPENEPYWKTLIKALEYDRKRIRAWFNWRDWKAMLRLMVIFVTICFVPLLVFYWLGFCIIKHGLKYFFLMIRIFIVGYLVESEWVLISWCGIILSFCLIPFEFFFFFFVFRYIPIRRWKYKKKIRKLFTWKFWIDWVFARLKGFLFFWIDLIKNIMKLWKHLNYTIEIIIIPTIQEFWWTYRSRPSLRSRLRYYRKRWKIKKIKLRFYKKIGRVWIPLHFFDIPILFILEQLNKLYYLFCYLRFWKRVNKTFIIKKTIKRIIGIIKCNINCYTKILILNFRIFFLKIKYYYYVFKIECITIWWNYIELFFLSAFFWKYGLLKLWLEILEGLDRLLVQILVAYYVEKTFLFMDLWHLRYRTSEYLRTYWTASKFTRTYAFARAEIRDDENPNAPRPCTEDTDIETEFTGKIWLKWLEDEKFDVNWSDIWDKPLTQKEWDEFFHVGENKKYFDGEGKIFFNSSQYKIFDANRPDRPKDPPPPLSIEEEKKKKEEEKKKKIEIFWKYIDRDIKDITNVFERTYGLCFFLKIMRFIFKIMSWIFNFIKWICIGIFNFIKWICIGIFNFIKWIWSKIILKIIYWICSKIILNLLKWIWSKMVKFAKWLGTE